MAAKRIGRRGGLDRPDGGCQAKWAIGVQLPKEAWDHGIDVPAARFVRPGPARPVRIALRALIRDCRKRCADENAGRVNLLCNLQRRADTRGAP
jgi:hypothetical protein